MSENSKPYYHAHEGAYREIKSKGYVGWGNIKTLSELGDETTKQFLNESILKYNPVGAEKKALDVGCGSGTTAFTLCKMGFQVTGVDISETAIQMAKDLAEQQNLKINFLTADVLHIEKLNTKFDVIYDSHCLHCIVFENDRMKVLTGIKESLAPSGIFILDTMVVPDADWDATGAIETLRFDSDFILWHKTKASAGYGIVELDGQHWCAQRRIYPVLKIMDELSTAGFEVLSHRLDHQKDESSMLRLVLKGKI